MDKYIIDSFILIKQSLIYFKFPTNSTRKVIYVSRIHNPVATANLGSCTLGEFQVLSWVLKWYDCGIIF